MVPLKERAIGDKVKSHRRDTVGRSGLEAVGAGIARPEVEEGWHALEHGRKINHVGKG